MDLGIARVAAGQRLTAAQLLLECQLRRDLPAAVGDLLLALLEKDPDRRAGPAGKVAAHLRALALGLA